VIKVDGTKPVDAARMLRSRAAAPSGSAFSLELPQETRSVASLAGPSPLASVDVLIALQEMSSATTGRAKAARRGKDMLDLLDDVRDGMLEGQVSRDTLVRLVRLVSVKREDFVDPGLEQVLDEIDLRARVELAKLNFADAR
jgi:Class II flagellar assembly regulator